MQMGLGLTYAQPKTYHVYSDLQEWRDLIAVTWDKIGQTFVQHQKELLHEVPAARHTHNENTPFTRHHKSSRATPCAGSASNREATAALLEVNKGETPSWACGKGEERENHRLRTKGPPPWAHSAGLQSFTFKSREPLCCGTWGDKHFRFCSFLLPLV